MLVFTGTDRLSHFLWDAYEDENHIYHNEFLSHFRKVDGVIGEIVSKLESDDSIIMLSDHGFERLDTEVNVNCLLEEEGLLKLKADRRSTISGINSGTVAFALDPARIYINTKDYPEGAIDDSDKGKVLDYLEDLFLSLEHEGKPVIKKVFRKEELYYGPLIEMAPDMVLTANSGFDLKARVDAEQIFTRSMLHGKHTQHDAFLFARIPGQKKVLSDKPKIYEVYDLICRGKRAGR